MGFEDAAPPHALPPPPVQGQDAVTAERYLATALRLEPHDAKIAEKYREIAAKVSVRPPR